MVSIYTHTICRKKNPNCLEQIFKQFKGKLIFMRTKFEKSLRPEIMIRTDK